MWMEWDGQEWIVHRQPLEPKPGWVWLKVAAIQGLLRWFVPGGAAVVGDSE